MEDKENIKEPIKEQIARIEGNFMNAMAEFTRQSGYVEGTLDAMISTTMDMNPEISMISDRLIKTFHAIEGICSRGLSKEFKSMLDLCKQLNMELEQEKQAKNIPTIDLDLAADIIKKKKAKKDAK